jgi:phosphotransferase system HPr-like phosphotransfer protein
MRKEVRVSLGGKNQIHQFITMNSKSACEIDVQDGHSFIDGKSILGVLSLNLVKPLDVTVIGEDSKITDLIDNYSSHQLLLAK